MCILHRDCASIFSVHVAWMCEKQSHTPAQLQREESRGEKARKLGRVSRAFPQRQPFSRRVVLRTLCLYSILFFFFSFHGRRALPSHLQHLTKQAETKFQKLIMINVAESELEFEFDAAHA